MGTHPHFDALTSGLAEPLAEDARDRVEAGLAEALVGASGAASAGAGEAFLRELGARLGSTTADALERLQVGDLFVAWRCLRGEQSALRVFEGVLDQAAAPLAAYGLGRPDIEEVLQATRVRLLVATGERPPRLALYSGQGRLGGFVRAAAVRVALNLRRAERRRSAVQELHRRAEEATDLQLVHMKLRYRDEFGAALEAAWQALSDDHRLLLRHQLVDQLTIDQLAAIYGIHRSTAARRLVGARDALVGETRRRLRENLGLSDEEVSSVLRLIRTRLDLAIEELTEGAPS